MYWQVYLHKTVLSAEKMLVKIIERAQELIANGIELKAASNNLEFFLKEQAPGQQFIKPSGKICTIGRYGCDVYHKKLVRPF